MTEHNQTGHDRIERLLEQLPQEKNPEVDLWSGIESAISQAAVWPQIPQELETEKDLWPAIESRIRREGRSRFSGWAQGHPRNALLAASLAVAVIAGFYVFGFYEASVPVPLDQGSVVASGQPDERSQEEAGFFLPAATSVHGIDAQTTYRQSIALVREQRLEIEESLAVYPTDPSLQSLWRHTYETELKLIDAAGRLLSTI